MAIKRPLQSWMELKHLLKDPTMLGQQFIWVNPTDQIFAFNSSRGWMLISVLQWLNTEYWMQNTEYREYWILNTDGNAVYPDWEHGSWMLISDRIPDHCLLSSCNSNNYELRNRLHLLFHHAAFKMLIFAKRSDFSPVVVRILSHHISLFPYFHISTFPHP